MSTSMPSTSASATASSASAHATQTITDLSLRFPGRVQIHLHPSTSFPPSLLSAATSSDGLPVALVWTVSSLRLLRGYGVTGSFTGTLAQFPQQNLFLGLPVQLLPEEVVFLVRRGRAVLVDESKSYRPGSVEERREVEGRVEAERKSQQLEAWGERQKLRARHSSTATSEPPTAVELESLPWYYTIPTTSDALPWYTPTTYTTLSAVQDLYPFPATTEEVGRCALFEHLVGGGMWCLNGLRFGGTFAVYPGDPLRYHSHYTAQLVHEAEPLSMAMLVANGRLGTGVKKTHLVCCVQGLDQQLKEELARRTAQEQQKPRALDAIKSARFDVAWRGDKDPTRNEGEANEKEATKLADFRIFSLAWSGFGT